MVHALKGGFTRCRRLDGERPGTIVASRINEGEPTTLPLALEGGVAQDVTLTPDFAASPLEVLLRVSSRRGFRMIPVGYELATQQAAGLPNVSRPCRMELLQAGDIPFTKTGRHRRVRADDPFACKERRDAARSDAPRDLARMDAEGGLA
ncbi:MAG: excisionase family DNA-binding protein [Boseongicola sp.]|nr:excisionase family DNA-binding protein [Boseongicola sp.]